MASTRLTAAERGEQVLRAAITAFAANGYAGTKTDEIARLAGVSQPYVIRLFGTKQQLFLAAVERVCDRIEQVFRSAAGEQLDFPREQPEWSHRTGNSHSEGIVSPASGGNRAELIDLGRAYNVFLEDRELLVVLLHGFAASADPVIGDPVRARFGKIYDLVRGLTGASVAETREFMAEGMLLAVMAAMQVAGPCAVPAPWAAEMLASFDADTVADR